MTPSGILLPLSINCVETKPVTWLWPGVIPIGKVTLLAGDPGRGKSLISLDIAARVSTGSGWPVAGEPSHAGRVLILSAEDDVADTIRPRLEAAGANLNKVHFLSNHFGEPAFTVQLPRDLAYLRNLLRSMKDVRLLVVDPLMAFVGQGFAANQGIRALVSEAQQLAAEAGAALIFITHLTKAPAASPLYRAMGSIGLAAAARAVYLCWPDDEAPGRNLLIPLKCNVGIALNAFAYSIESTEHGAGSPRITWEPEAVPLSIMATSTANPIPRIEDARCASWLKGILEEGPLAVTAVQSAARAAGFSRNALRRAKKALQVVSRPIQSGGEWEMWLPTKGDSDVAQTPPGDARTEGLSSPPAPL
jgi:hypothetical protein